jgi:high-affinity Fe2+/Pb2+ permease
MSTNHTDPAVLPIAIAIAIAAVALAYLLVWWLS